MASFPLLRQAFRCSDVNLVSFSLLFTFLGLGIGVTAGFSALRLFVRDGRVAEGSDLKARGSEPRTSRRPWPSSTTSSGSSTHPASSWMGTPRKRMQTSFTRPKVPQDLGNNNEASGRGGEAEGEEGGERRQRWARAVLWILLQTVCLVRVRYLVLTPCSDFV